MEIQPGKIEKGIPPPNPTHKGGKYASVLRAMKVGESAWWPIHQHQISPCISNVKRKSKMEFISRSVDGGTRVWRTK